MEVTTEMSCLVCVLSTIMANPRDTKNLHCGRIECVRLRESVVSAKMPAPPTCTKIMQSKSIDLRFTTCAEVCIRQTALLPSPAQKRVDSPQRSLFHYGFLFSSFSLPFNLLLHVQRLGGSVWDSVASKWKWPPFMDLTYLHPTHSLDSSFAKASRQ